MPDYLQFATIDYGNCIADSRFIPVLATIVPDACLIVRPELRRLFSQLGVRLCTADQVTPGELASAMKLVRGMDFGASDAVGYGMEVRQGDALRVRLPRTAAAAPAPLWSDSSIRLPATDRLRVGLCWHGGLGPRRDCRAVPVHALRPLLSLNVQLIALHDKAASVFELRALPGADDVQGLEDLGVRDWADTAAVVRQLDLVVTADTPVFHLSAALGCRTCLLAADNKQVPWMEPDARHLHVPYGGPWYPTARLLRQRSGNWAPAVAEVRCELEQMGKPPGDRSSGPGGLE